MKRIYIGLFFLILALSLPVYAENKIVLINSPDWKDIYSGIVYANLNGLPFDFLSTEKQLTYKLKALQNFEQILLIEPKQNPLVFGYKNDMEQKGYKIETIPITKTVNLDLGKIVDTKRFILLDGTYASNAISVVPYSTLTKSYVFFVNKENIKEIVSLLKEKKTENILIYGFIDPNVKKSLEEFNLEEINEGDRLNNNIAIAKKYYSISPIKQVTLSSGNFIEEVMMRGAQPILFIGETEVSDSLVDYLQKSSIYIGEVVGNELTRSATKLKRLLKNKGKDFFVIIRFGKATVLEGVEEPKRISALDMVYLPQGTLSVNITGVSYNRATKQLELSYENTGKVSVYLKSTIKIIIDGENIKRLGDEEPFFILPGEKRIMGYELDLSDKEPLEEKSRLAEILTQYGEGTKTLDKILEGSYPINIIAIKDDSALEVRKITYSADIYKNLLPWESKQSIKMHVKNTGDNKVYYKAALTLKKNGVDETYKKDDTLSLTPDKEDIITFEASLTGVDKNVTVDIAYGGKKDLLIKRVHKEIRLEPTYGTDITIVSILAVIAIALIFFLVRKKKKKKGTKRKKKNTLENKKRHR